MDSMVLFKSKLDKCKSILKLDRVKKYKKQFYEKNINIKQDHNVDGAKFSFVRLKETLKRHPGFYRFLIKVISHEYIPCKIRDELIKNCLDLNGIVVNMASGNYIINEDVINIDLYDYSNVDIISDATNLPLKDNSVDLVINESSLEHIYDYKSVIAETYRILKFGGKAYFVIPFLYEFHASPNDFHRFTSEGLKKLFKEFDFFIEKLGPSGGIASSFIGILIEFFSILLSFGIRGLYKFWVVFFMLVLFPIKFLDYFLNKIPYSTNAAASLYIVVQKNKY
jgi:SAM-dependent methyltransferase